MQRYLLFASDVYYPAGGWSDLIRAYDSLSEAQVDAVQYSGKLCWYQIVDLETRTVVLEG